MANARGKAIDKTHLSIDAAEERGFIHRDYIAHCFRWSHVVKYLLQKHRYKTATILDIGCGKEVPLAKLLYSNKMSGCTYIGVDVNKLDHVYDEFNFGKMIDDITLIGRSDVCEAISIHSELDRMVIEGELFHRPTVITCFEVLEHVEPEHTIRILKKIRELLSTEDGSVAFISTPCFNGEAAANHVNEITYEALGCLIQDLGFGIKGVYGTFASQRDIEPYLMPDIGAGESDSLWEAYQELKDYYDSNVLSTIFAPLFPEASRNALWVITADPQENQPRLVFPKWDELDTPWTSSELWGELKPGD